jgi:hypothetical protein
VDERGKYPEYLLPHSEFGNPQCPGLFFPSARGNVVDLMCNDCGFVLCTVPPADVERMQDELQAAVGGGNKAQCPRCGIVNRLPPFTEILAFTCRNCGEPLSPPDGDVKAGR